MDIKDRYYKWGVAFIQPFQLPAVDDGLNFKRDIIQQMDDNDVLRDYLKGLSISYEMLNIKVEHYCNIDTDDGVVTAKLAFQTKKLEKIKNVIEFIHSYFDNKNTDYDKDGNFIVPSSVDESNVGEYFDKIFNTKEKKDFYFSRQYIDIVNSGVCAKGFLPENWRDFI